MSKTAIAGNHGETIRSDCKITLHVTDKGGKEINIQSRVKAIYGKSILALTEEILSFYKLDNIHVLIEDSGALPHVIAARMEAAIKQIINDKRDFLLPINTKSVNPSIPDRFRLSRLYLPGNNPAMMINAGIHHPDGIILDLEDSVAPEKKAEARILVRNTLRAIDFYGAERMVRINQLPLGLEDLKAAALNNINMILLPKCERASQIEEINNYISELFKKSDKIDDILIMPIIESALGIENSYQIATASKRVVAMAIGLEDYTADLGVSRTEEGKESFYARTRIVNACKAAGIQPIDSVYSDVANVDGLRENVKESKELGFEGMGCIHPSQIKLIHEGYLPTESEIEKAKKIVEAFYEAKKKGLGVVSLGSKMIDAPVVKRAVQTLSLIGEKGYELE